MNIDQMHFSDRVEGVSGSAIREILKLTSQPGMISFAGGNPGDFALPDALVARLAGELLLERGKALLQYGITEGYPPLRGELPNYLAEEFGVSAAPEEILLTTGSQQGIDLLCRALVNPGDVILTENPTFLGATQAMRLCQARIVPVDSDGEGLDPDALERQIALHRPKLLYLIPTFQNPTGLTLSLSRRKRIAEIASRHGLVVAEDDPYRQLRYRGSPLPSIKSFDREGWVTLLGSFSKVVAPGLRVGFLAGPAGLIRKCTICKQSADVHTPTLNQAIIHAFLSRKMLESHLASLRAGYGQRLSAMLEALEQWRGIRRFTRPEGGLFVFVTLEEDADASELLKTAIASGVAFVPGEPFHIGGGHRNTLRLNFTSSDGETIRRGMKILFSCVQQARGGSEG